MLIEDALNLALEKEKAGQVAEAEKICRAIVSQYPETVPAWNLLGMIAARQGRADAAVEHMNRAIAIEPNSAALHANLGELKKRLGRFDEAATAYRDAVRLEPDSAIMHNKLAIALRLTGKLTESIAEFDRAIELEPAYADPHNNRGNALRDMGRLDEAASEYEQAIKLKPNLAEAHANLGNIFSDRGEFDKALAAYQVALRLQPNYPEALNNFASTLRRIRRFDEALAACREALRLKPGYGEAYNTLGSIYYDLEQFDEAIDAYESAIEIEPRSWTKRNNLAVASGAAGRFEEAIRSAKAAVELKTDYAEGFNTLGNLFADQGRYDEAAAAFGRAIQLRPDYALAHWNYSFIPLLRGDFETGWAEHEWRMKTKVESRPQEFSEPIWDGTELNGMTILLHHEQGFGDAIQFVRYAPLVAKRGGKVMLNCPTELAALFREMPEISVLSGEGALPLFDFHCPLLSLPAVFKTRLDSIPADVPYLKAPGESVAQWREIIGTPDKRLRIGLAWAGNPKRKLDQRRSIALDQLSPLTKTPNARFYSLQKGAYSIPEDMELIDHTAQLHDFAETAGLIDNLDLVITVDTAVAHLAGAMGKSVWVLLGFVPAWRWMLDRSDSPWYPTMRLFRQPAIDDWKTPISQIENALRKMLVK